MKRKNQLYRSRISAAVAWWVNSSFIYFKDWCLLSLLAFYFFNYVFSLSAVLRFGKWLLYMGFANADSYRWPWRKFCWSWSSSRLWSWDFWCLYCELVHDYCQWGLCFPINELSKFQLFEQVLLEMKVVFPRGHTGRRNLCCCIFIRNIVNDFKELG